MPYEAVATAKTPALVIYLLDCSYSMQEKLDGVQRIEHVNAAIEQVLVRMVQRSTKGEIVSPRYRLSLITYSNQAEDILGGIQSIDEVVKKGKPRLSTLAATDTAAAFMKARDILQQELPNIPDHPAPMVCHLTDGEYNGADPEPIAREIMGLSNNDGNVLVENIYIGSDLTHAPIDVIEDWEGIKDESELKSPYAKKLYDMSSPLPESHANVIQEEGYNLKADSRMLIPGLNKDLIELAFTMSGATPTA